MNDEIKITEFPIASSASENDFVTANIAYKASQITLKDVFENVSLSGLETGENTIKGAINELNNKNTGTSNEFTGTTEQAKQAIQNGEIVQGMIVNIVDDFTVVSPFETKPMFTDKVYNSSDLGIEPVKTNTEWWEYTIPIDAIEGYRPISLSSCFIGRSAGACALHSFAVDTAQIKVTIRLAEEWVKENNPYVICRVVYGLENITAIVSKEGEKPVIQNVSGEQITIEASGKTVTTVGHPYGVLIQPIPDSLKGLTQISYTGTGTAIYIYNQYAESWFKINLEKVD